MLIAPTKRRECTNANSWMTNRESPCAHTLS